MSPRALIALLSSLLAAAVLSTCIYLVIHDRGQSADISSIRKAQKDATEALRRTSLNTRRIQRLLNLDDQSKPKKARKKIARAEAKARGKIKRAADEAAGVLADPKPAAPERPSMPKKPFPGGAQPSPKPTPTNPPATGTPPAITPAPAPNSEPAINVPLAPLPDVTVCLGKLLGVNCDK